jgi:hypothetical protein
MAIDAQILDAFQTTLESLPWGPKVESENIIIGLSDTQDHEHPLIQIYDNGQSFTHEKGRIRVRWEIIVELVLRSSSTTTINMRTLLNRRQEIEQAIGENVNLGISGVFNVLYLQNTPDIHLARPFYMTELTFVVDYYKPYVSNC